MRTETVVVTAPDGAAGDESLPLTWAQANMWDAIWGYGPDGTALIMRRTLRPAADLPVEAAIGAVRSFVARHEVCRTTYRRQPPGQWLNGEVRLRLAVLAADDVAAAEQELLAALSAEPFAHESEPPLRVGLVESGGRVASVVLAVSHLSFDDHSASLVRDTLAAELEAGPAGTRPAAWEDNARPGRLVELEASDRLQEQSRATIERWKQAMAALPDGRGIAPPAPSTYSAFELRSAALAVAAQTTAVRTRTSGSSVVLAALTSALRELLPGHPAALQLITGNRHRPELADFAGITLQNGLFVAPRGEDFTDLVRQTHRAAFWAHRNARYDTAVLRRDIFDLQDRGDAPDLSFFYNYVRGTVTDWTGLEQRQAELPALTAAEADTEPTLVGQRTYQDFSLFLHVIPAVEECRLLLVCDEKEVDGTTVRALLNRVRALVVGSATDGEPTRG